MDKKEVTRDSMPGPLGSNEYKVIIIGGLGVGKTSLLLRYVHDTFEDRVSRFVAEEKKGVTINGQEIVLDIWDTAGKPSMPIDLCPCQSCDIMSIKVKRGNCGVIEPP